MEEYNVSIVFYKVNPSIFNIPLVVFDYLKTINEDKIIFVDNRKEED